MEDEVHDDQIRFELGTLPPDTSQTAERECQPIQGRKRRQEGLVVRSPS